MGKIFGFLEELASSLEYTDPKEAIQDHVDPEDKMGIKELLGSNFTVVLKQSFKGGVKITPPSFFHNLQPNQKVINEYGFLSLYTKSRKEKVKPFQKWVYKTIKEIRETGSYTLPSGPVDNPLDLVVEIETLKREIQTLKKETKTCDKGTQTLNIKKMKKSFEKLRAEMERSVERMEEETEKIINNNKIEKLVEEIKDQI